MSISAILVMIIGMVLIWGGLVASIIYAMKKAKNNQH
ncbi:MAG TPA: methionine/alanine import family NSS transporter small subunit [Bacillota bacterium]|nr:methionine/alanine import family NSS transporter small subunit [Bacillota bacterium]